MRKWLLEARTKSGLTMAQMADKIGISESYYSYIENGERQKNMDITLATKLSMILNIPISEIVEMESK